MISDAVKLNNQLISGLQSALEGRFEVIFPEFFARSLTLIAIAWTLHQRLERGLVRA